MEEETAEKRRLLNFVFSNSTWKNGKLYPAYRKPFDLLVLTNTAYQEEKAVSPNKNGLWGIWIPFVDSFRTLCLAPTSEVRATLIGIQQLQTGN